MKVLCIGGHNDGAVITLDANKRDGETHSLTYRVPLTGDGIDGNRPWSPLDDDTKLTFSAERYTVREICFSPHERVTVLVANPRATYREIFKTLIQGYRSPKEIDS